jgi:spore coat protein U-like protein
MKKLLMAAVAVSALATTPAFAADTVASYTVTGTVAAVCSANTSGSITFGALTDGTGTLTATSKDATTDSGAYCNGLGSTITIAHSDLAHTTFTGTPATGFTKTVTFVPEVDTGSVVTTGDQGPTVIGAFSQMTVRAKDLNSGGSKPLAGSYSGSITVTLSPLG